MGKGNAHSMNNLYLGDKYRKDIEKILEYLLNSFNNFQNMELPFIIVFENC